MEKIDTAGKVTVVAGTVGQDGVPADGKLKLPTGVAVDKDGNVYVADAGNHLVVKVAPSPAPPPAVPPAGP